MFKINRKETQKVAKYVKNSLKTGKTYDKMRMKTNITLINKHI